MTTIGRSHKKHFPGVKEQKVTSLTQSQATGAFGMALVLALG